MNEILIGIAIGLITASLIWLARLVWLEVISPRIQDLTYQGVKIEGTWISAYPSWDINLPGKPDYVEEVILKRRGHNVSGTMKVLTGGDQGSLYEFDGTFHDNILTVTYVAADRSALDRGCYSMMLKNNGRTFIGHSTFYEDDDHEIVTHNYEWTKKVV